MSLYFSINTDEPKFFSVYCANDTETYRNQPIRRLLSGPTDSELLDLIIIKETNVIRQSVQQLIDFSCCWLSRQFQIASEIFLLD